MKEIVTIITLAYNSMSTIYQTIDSILIQDYEMIEIIIADDCSAEFDCEGIKSYIEKNRNKNIINYLVYQNEKNSGTVRNLNRAIKKASGQIIMNLSADDIFYNKHIVSEIANEFEKSGCDFLVTRRAAFVNDTKNIERLIPDDYEIWRISKFTTPIQECIALYCGEYFNMASGSVFYYKRDFIDEMGYFDEKYILWEDGPFFAKINKQGKMINYNYNIVSIYYRLGGVSTGSPSKALKNDLVKFLEEGISSRDIKGIHKRVLKKWYFNLVSNHKKFSKRIISFFKYPDVYLYQLKRKLNSKLLRIKYAKV